MMMVNAWKRFADLLDHVSDDEEEEAAVLAIPTMKIAEAQLLGPFGWSIHMQRAVDSFKDFHGLEFSVTIADPSQEDCPLVACSIGFTKLTGYSVDEIVGRNCRFLLNNVPVSLIHEETRIKCRGFCDSASEGTVYALGSQELPDGTSLEAFRMPKGELICVQTNATKSGMLFKSMFTLKQVELDDEPFIVALQAELSPELEGEYELPELQEKCKAAWMDLDKNMSIIEKALCSKFWYTGSMRTQAHAGDPFE